MKVRTIEELHDREIGHKKFAKVCDLLIKKGFKISDIKEYNEKFTYQINGSPASYDKCWKASANEYVKLVENVMRMSRILRGTME